MSNNKLVINTFGFGKEHDAELMSNIAKVQDGNFYYVEKFEDVDVMFVDALGALISIVAENVELTLRTVQKNKKFQDVTIERTYGPFWYYNEIKNEYKIKLDSLMMGGVKDFLLDIQIPPIDIKVSDLERNTVLLEAILTVQTTDRRKIKVTKKAELELTIYNEDEEIALEINENVEMN